MGTIIGPAIPALVPGSNMTFRTRAHSLTAWDPFPMPESYMIEVGTRARRAGGLNGNYPNHSIRNGVHTVSNCIAYHYYQLNQHEFIIVLYDTPSSVKMLVLMCRRAYIHYWRPQIVQGYCMSDLWSLSPYMPITIRGLRYNVSVGMDDNMEPTVAHMWPTDPAQFNPRHTHASLMPFRAKSCKPICMNVRRHDGFCEGYVVRHCAETEFVTIMLDRINTYGFSGFEWGSQLRTTHKVYTPSKYDESWYYSIDTIEWRDERYYVALSSRDRNPQVSLVSATSIIGEFTCAQCVKFDAVLDPGMVYWSHDGFVNVSKDGVSSVVISMSGLHHNDNTHNIIIDEDPHIRASVIDLMFNLGWTVPRAPKHIDGSLKFGIASLVFIDGDNNRTDYVTENIRRVLICDCRETYFDKIPRDIVGLINEYLDSALPWSPIVIS